MLRRITEIQKKYNNIVNNFQTFCLNPSYENYKQIINCEKLKRLEGNDYIIWQKAVEYKYNYFTKLHLQDENNKLKKEFFDMCDEIIKSLEKKPSRTSLNAIWHLFFATGEYKYQVYAYLFISNSNISKSLSNYAIDLFENIKKLYINQIDIYQNISINWFDELKVEMDIINFNRIRNKAEEKINDMNDEKQNLIKKDDNLYF